MNNKTTHDEDLIENLDEFEAEVYDAFVELGWLIPQTEEEVERALESMKETECPPLPPELADPAPLIERLRIEEEEQTAIKIEEQTSLRLVASPIAVSEQLNFANATKQPVDLTAINADTPSFQALLRAEVQNEPPSVIAKKMYATTSFLKLISDHKETVPDSWTEELVRKAKNVYSIDEARARRSLRNSGHQQIAASRTVEYSNKTLSWQEILQESEMPPEMQEFWKHLAEQGA